MHYSGIQDFVAVTAVRGKVKLSKWFGGVTVEVVVQNKKTKRGKNWSKRI